MRHTLLIAAGLAALASLAGCASSASSQSFPAGQARTAFSVHYGELVSMREVEIEGEATAVGRYGGAAIGMALGRGDSRWYSNPRRLESAVGGVAGAVAGEAVERTLRRQDGIELVVRLDRGDTIAVVQSNDLPFSPGDKVQVLYGANGDARVQPL